MALNQVEEQEHLRVAAQQEAFRQLVGLGVLMVALKDDSSLPQEQAVAQPVTLMATLAD